MIRPVRRAAAAVSVLAVALATGACGGSSSAEPAPRAATRQVDPARGLTQDQAERALLAAADLPLGFRRQDGGTETTALGCAGIDGVYLADGAAARAAVSFGHAVSDAFLNETISTRPGGAQRALAAFGRAARDCGSFTGRDGTAYRVTPLELPRYGDGSAAVRVSSGLSEGRPVELVAVRVGDTLVVLAGAGTPDATLIRTVVSRAMAKVDRAR